MTSPGAPAHRDPSRYEALLAIGAGGMATVSVGRARGAAGFSRLVALKRAHPHVRDDARAARALKREARLASRLDHPNVVRVLDVTEEAGELTLVLDYVEGASLAALTGAGACLGGGDVRARARAALRVVLDVAAGLDAAHRALDEAGRPLGLIHRDVTPSNVLVGEDGVARLTDFGIAKSLERALEWTETGVLLGKIAYMSPEYVEHGRATASGDLFSLGVVAWEALTATRLFRSATDFETVRRVVAAKVPELASVAAELAPLDGPIARALARRPDERPPSVAAFAAELEAAGRAADLVGTHAEVAECVARAVGSELAERRRRLVSASRGQSAGEHVIRAGRDEVSTALIDARPPRARGRAARARAGAFLLVALLGAIGIFAARSRDVPGPPPATTTTAADPRSTATITAPLAEMTDAVTADAAGAEAAADAGGAEAAADAAGAEATADAAGAEVADAAAPASGGRATAPRPARGAAGERARPAGPPIPKKAPPNPYLP